MGPFLKSSLYSVLRHALGYISGFFTTKGLLTSGEATDLVVALATGLTAILMALWDKWQTEKKVDVALAMPPGATRAALEAEVAK